LAGALRAVAVGSVVAFSRRDSALRLRWCRCILCHLRILNYGLLYRELLRTHSVDIVSFYARRARRILPAFAVVVLASLIFGAMSLTTVDEQQNLAASSVAAVRLHGNHTTMRILTTGKATKGQSGRPIKKASECERGGRRSAISGCSQAPQKIVPQPNRRPA
jgi:hypothetical protein